MRLPFLALPLSVALFISCGQNELKEPKAITSTERFVQPPIPDVIIPYQDYSLEAEKGDTLFYESGSILVFPSNSFVDNNGNIIKGKVKVKYREFSNPMDFFLSGIPMNYDSAGVKYNFESAGMCEVLAYKDDDPVFVNPNRKPTINLKSENNSSSFSLYFLDTVERRWTYRGTSAPIEIKASKPNKGSRQLVKQELEKPIKPIKANDKMPVIQVDVDPASFKELMAYNNMLFQLDPSEKNFNENDSLNEWNSIKLNRTNEYGVYRVSFSNDNTSVSYLARPVFEGENYEKALIVFEQKRIAYERELSKAITNDKKNKEQYVLDSLEDAKENLRIAKLNTANREKYIKDSLAYQKIVEENERIAQLNVLIKARNEDRARQRAMIEQQMAIIDKQNALRKQQAARIDSANKERYKEAQKREEAMNRANAIYRSFEIDRFGVSNCDKPMYTPMYAIEATFTDSSGNVLPLSNIAVVYSQFNGILRYADNNIQLSTTARNMICGIYNDQLAYARYNFYDDPNRIRDSKQLKFEMTLIPVSEMNHKRVRRLVEKP